MTENAVFVSTGGKNGGKSLRFRKYPDTCGRGLSTEMALMTDDKPEVPSHINKSRKTVSHVHLFLRGI